MKRLIPALPFVWGMLSVVLVAVGAGMIYLPAGFIAAGLLLFVDLQRDKAVRE